MGIRFWGVVSLLQRRMQEPVQVLVAGLKRLFAEALSGPEGLTLSLLSCTENQKPLGKM